MGLKGYSVGGDIGGEIVEVQGGHIIRATGRKDRHSKVFTSKGPRDRRVRLSAHTAIQFYDVQDRLGYDRPSKAVDWLIKKAKSAIEKLEVTQEPENNTNTGSSPPEPNLVNNQTQFVAANLDPEDAMKTFFPATTTTTTTGGGTNMNFQNYPHHGDDNIVSRTAARTTPNLSQDLGLSLHTFQGNNNNNNNTVVPETNSFVTTPFETFGRISGWNHHDLAMTSPSSPSEQEQERSNGGFMVNHHHHQPSMMTLLNSQQQQVFLGGQQQQRGTLQSSLFPHSIRSWDHHHHHHQTTSDHHHNQASSSVMFASPSQFGSHGMMMMQGLSFPIHGEEATQPNSPSSTPNSHL
ncbi:hypothetical protein EUTSA_v10016870mg [Eutrema salsugineum]|uniref:TCP domain-containing protein n=2 Tax=Eutrema TaxID=98005 RepID=V4M605_EUTSA|nr:transcription factor TCP10 [Eutrema salsugineum]XP_006410231.1 transcription factor TCP10 [Eutrema salsugineum]XP_024003662.1 transcription factor TCP10 [Eutrema salsugineum]BAJ34111.1 unnamed protein product [Eutrema halophilum]ESQ51683.1 hypothetical protein EUTSA_v10016870mg [Eutrema salsugineum]ESQ51684.1 hypothetical protein EUTSA_v10016870mg [Eutrema salsugineum]